MTVGDLRKALFGLRADLPVHVEVAFNDGDDFEGAELQKADVETRCDGVAALYLYGDQDAE